MQRDSRSVQSRTLIAPNRRATGPIRGLLFLILGLPSLAIGCDSGLSFPTRDASIDQAREGGPVSVTAVLNVCPEVVVVVSPNRGGVGVPLEVSAHAAVSDQKTLTYSWKADSGTFADSMAVLTTFTCTQPGSSTITLTVSDGKCEATQTVSVVCVISDGGAPDSGSPDGGSPDAASDAKPGTGGTNGSGGGSGTGGSSGGSGGRVGSGGTTSSGGSSGTGGTTVGSGGVTGGGVTGSGGTTGSGGVTSSGGTTGSGGAHPAGGSNGNPDPTMDNTACNDCTAGNCNTGPPPATDGCDGLTDHTEQLDCQALYKCIRDHQCANVGDAIGCFCGTADQHTTCTTIPGAADGPCKDEFATAAQTDDPAKIFNRFSDPAYAIGRADNLAACRGSFCTAECSIP